MVFCDQEQGVTEENDLLEEGQFSSESSGIDVFPANIIINSGQQIYLTAIAKDFYGDVIEVTERSQWVSNAADTADFIESDKPGLLKAIGQGIGTITVSYGGAEKTVDFQILDPSLEGVSLSLESVELEIFESESSDFIPRSFSLSAIAIYSDGSYENATDQVAWDVQQESDVLVDQGSGLFQAVSLGDARVGATLAGFSSSAPVSVLKASKEVLGIELDPKKLIFPLPSEINVIASARLSDGSLVDVSKDIEVLVQAGSNVELGVRSDGTKFLGSRSTGQTSVIVTYAGLETEVDVLVIDPISSRIELLSPSSGATPAGFAETFSVNLVLSDGSIEDITAQAAWEVSNPGILAPRIKASEIGIYDAKRRGEVSITVTFSSLVDQIQFNVLDPIPLNLRLESSDSGPLALGLFRDYQLFAEMSDGSAVDVTETADWSVTPGTGSAILSLSQSGRVIADGVGDVTIDLLYSDLDLSQALTISNKIATEIQITAGAGVTVSLAGGNQQLTGTVIFSDGTTEDRTTDIDWRYNIVGNGLSFAGYVLNTSGQKGICVPVAKGFFEAIAEFDGLTEIELIEVVD